MLHNHCSIHSMNEQKDNEHTNGHTEELTEGHRNIQADGHTNIQADEHTNGQTYEQADGHTDEHANVHADGPTFIVVGGGGNCVSFGTHLNKHLDQIHIHPDLLTS